MKKPATLILAALMICMMTCPALAAELPGNTAPARSAELFPSEVVETLEGDHHRLEKIYLLTAADNPSNIPTEDFEREGYHYTLLDVTRQDYTESDVKEYSERKSIFSLYLLSYRSCLKLIEQIWPRVETILRSW